MNRNASFTGVVKVTGNGLDHRWIAIEYIPPFRFIGRAKYVDECLAGKNSQHCPPARPHHEANSVGFTYKRAIAQTLQRHWHLSSLSVRPWRGPTVNV